MRTAARLAGILETQRGFLFPWVPVLMGIGTGWYFALRAEPAPELWWGLGAGLVLLAGAAAVLRGAWAPWLVLPAAVMAGFCLAGWRTAEVAAPVLSFRYYGPIEGRVVEIDRSASDKLRLTLDRVVLSDVPPERVPARVRVSLHGTQDYVRPEPGMVVILTGHLAAPEGPVEPGGYDFRRQAWFDRLGAVGYTRTPVLMLEPPAPGLTLFFARLRMAMSARVQQMLPGQAGAFAAVLMTGDRSGLTRQTQDDLRASNLSHLLSISGLHMVLLCGTVFAALRFGLALIAPLALRLPIRKIAALAALAVGLFYYFLSGQGVPAERAYIMIAVMFGAVLVGRRAISLRSVALAAILVLTFRPETMVEPGFQMSFAATVALVVAFQALRHLPKLPDWSRGLVTLVASSAVAGAATAPFAAAHFNRIADYGLIANLLSVPLMGLIVMPAALVAVLLWPLGMAPLALWVMGWPLRWILGVAHGVAGLSGAVTRVPAPPVEVLPLIALGGLFLVLWQARLPVRLAGVLPMMAALLIWSQVERPALLISGDGALLGLMTPEGRALSKPRGQGFAAASWLEDDGDAADQPAAAARMGFGGGSGETTATVAGLTLRQFWGRGAATRAVAACGTADLLILGAEASVGLPRGCRMIDRRMLARTGPMAIWATREGPRIETVRQVSGERRWMRALPEPKAPLVLADR